MLNKWTRYNTRVPDLEQYVTIPTSHLLPTKDWQRPALFTLCLICSAKCNLNKRGIEVDINYTCKLMKHYYDRFFRKAIFIVWYLTCSWLWAFRSGELWAVLSGCIAGTHTDTGSKFIANNGTQLQTRITQGHSLSAFSFWDTASVAQSVQ